MTSSTLNQKIVLAICAIQFCCATTGLQSNTCVGQNQVIDPFNKKLNSIQPAQVIENHLNALGGQTFLESIKSISTQSQITIEREKENQVVETSLRQSGNQVSITLNVGASTVQMGSNGTTSWVIQPGPKQFGGGPRILQGKEKLDFERQFSQPIPTLSWLKFDGKIEIDGTETVNGKDCLKLVFTDKDESKVIRFFNSETWLIEKMITYQESATGPIASIVIPSDYRTLQGLTMPFKQTNIVGNSKFMKVVQVTAVRINGPIVENTFEPPKPIKALMAKSLSPSQPAKQSAAPAVPESTPPVNNGG